jgi:hypothetical protein
LELVTVVVIDPSVTRSLTFTHQNVGWFDLQGISNLLAAQPGQAIMVKYR